MKGSPLLTANDLVPQFETVCRELFERVPFLTLDSLKTEARLSSQSTCNAGLIVEVKSGGKRWVLVFEAKRLGQPREVRTAVLQLEHYLQRLPKATAHYGVVLAPFISEESARICTEAGMGYADLAGNARLSFDQVFIETRRPDNPFRERRERRSLFAPRAARVLRVLLQGPLHPWKVAELAESARVSLGWVSAVRQQLLAREWAAVAPGGLRVTKPGAVLEAWSKADDWEKRAHTQEYSSLLSDPVELAEALKELSTDEPPVFTQWFAGWLRHPHTTPAVVSAYVRRFPDETLIREKLLARRVSAGGGRLRLVMPKDEGVFRPSQTVRGFELVSDAQIYLDLLQGGLRGEEQAEELRRWPEFAGGWT